MRVRTAKKLAQRIDLYYFTRARGMRRWRMLLSAALPIVVLVWIAAAAATGSRRPYSAGPVSAAHAFTEQKCEVCHAPRSFRAHTTETACLMCHQAPEHVAGVGRGFSRGDTPACSDCHQEHRGRVSLAKTDDRFCVQCHADLKPAHGLAQTAAVTDGFPAGHPEFAAVRAGAPPDRANLAFNHAVHLKDSLRGPNGPEKLECSTCHKPEATRAIPGGKRPRGNGLMAPVSYQQQCARCHPLFFDERIEQPAPHDTPELVQAFVRQALADYIRRNPGDITKPDSAVRRVPLNFPRPPAPLARTPGEWVDRRAAADERILWNKTCEECHVSAAVKASPGPAVLVQRVSGLPIYARTDIPARWMPRAAFTHTPHQMVACTTCHAAATGSTKTADVLLPNQAICATCHAPTQAESRCFECHRYHDWTHLQARSS